MNDAKPSLVLIGLRASGKSTLGRLLAEQLDRAFVDLDDVTCALLNADGAGAAIETHGIDAFREAETKALTSALNESGQIIALGGGTPTAPGCSTMLEESSSRVIYLRALPSTLQDRLKATDNSNRPALVGNDVINEVQTLFDQRDELYRSLAESVIHTDGLTQKSAIAALFAVAKAGI
ncbi:MAG: shikimate kinase [Phycisphaerales bacterium]|nr:shikimate kinase [Phycisphaerales bacterium]